MGVREPHVVLHRDDVNETKVGLSESVQQTDVEQDFKEEQLRRNLNVLTITIFTAIATSSWVFVLRYALMRQSFPPDRRS